MISWLSPLHCILYFLNVDYFTHCDQWQNQPRRNLIKATWNKRAQRRTTSEISEFGNLWPGCRSLKVVGLTGCVKYCCARNLHVFLQRCVSTPLRYFPICTIVKRTHIQQQPQTWKVWSAWTIKYCVFSHSIVSSNAEYNILWSSTCPRTSRPQAAQSFSGTNFFAGIPQFLVDCFLPPPRFLPML